jgi:hypothetical protein
MIRRPVVALAGIACAAAMLAAPMATGASTAAKPVQIDVAGGPQGGNPDGGGGRFTLRSAGTPDAGASTYSFVFSKSGTTSLGQPFAHVKGTIYLTGKRGGLVLAVKGLTYGATGDGVTSGRDVWTGTWNVTSASGGYAGTKGTGAFVGIVGPSVRVALRLNGRF